MWLYIWDCQLWFTMSWTQLVNQMSSCFILGFFCFFFLLYVNMDSLILCSWGLLPPQISAPWAMGTSGATNRDVSSLARPDLDSIMIIIMKIIGPPRNRDGSKGFACPSVTLKLPKLLEFYLNVGILQPSESFWSSIWAYFFNKVGQLIDALTGELGVEEKSCSYLFIYFPWDRSFRSMFFWVLL